MKQILVRADDLGYSRGVNYGIMDSVRHGIVRSVGLMPNMPEAKNGFDLIKDLDVCIGQHTNICVGKPLCDPKDIPSLVD
ncbi:ChbG/HpnK family deacetylase, partial [uncultured Dubosiella sp.]